ncbi:MAG: hypothetical protein RIK87_19500 [Fuerstiella sp.]
MGTAGKFCLVVTLLLLLLAMVPIPGPWGGWTPKLLVIHNEWSQKIRDGKEDVQKKREAEIKARQELMKAAAELEALQIGWDKSWEIPARGPNVPQAAPTISNRNGELVLNNLGVNQGLVNSTTTDEAGNTQTVRPVIHAFYGNAEGSTYVGEFIATDIGPNNAVLKSVHGQDPNEVASWPMNASWRLRTMIPAASRARIDELYRRAIRTGELTRQTQANKTRQEALLAAAQQALQVRTNELLGDANREPVPGRPEFTEGLLQVTEDVEEERNQLLLYVDTLRRDIKSQSESRDARLEALQQAMESLPGASSDYDTLTPQVAVGQ